MDLMAIKYNKIGVERLWFNSKNSRWYVSLTNRTYYNVFLIPKEKENVWQNEFNSYKRKSNKFEVD
jgi:hypothetical protein